MDEMLMEQFIGRHVIVAAGRPVPMTGQGRLIKRPDSKYHIELLGGAESVPFAAGEVLKIRIYDGG
jgi:hypothetical protein